MSQPAHLTVEMQLPASHGPVQRVEIVQARAAGCRYEEQSIASDHGEGACGQGGCVASSQGMASFWGAVKGFERARWGRKREEESWERQRGRTKQTFCLESLRALDAQTLLRMRIMLLLWDLREGE